MSIATKSGDGGETALAGGERVSKGDDRVGAYGAIDELVSVMGFARSICDLPEVAGLTEKLQRELFTVGGLLVKGADEELDAAWVDALGAEVERLEALPGMLDDWALPGGHPAAAAYDVARTVCRRAERSAVALRDGGHVVPASVVVYLNRLSDLLWLLGRRIEKEAGVDGGLRGKGSGPRWSRAW
jgi:cob(I)alamin adenosyltransferase